MARSILDSLDGEAPHVFEQDGRHVDSFWPLWNLFDLTPEGRGTNWYPRLRYD